MCQLAHVQLHPHKEVNKLTQLLNCHMYPSQLIAAAAAAVCVECLYDVLLVVTTAAATAQ